MIVLLGIAGMSFGWFVYSKFIATKIYQLDPDFVTPAHELNDGVDYHPTNKYVLWGHHFHVGCGRGADRRSCHRGLLGLGACRFVGHFRHDLLCGCARFRRALGECAQQG